MKIAVLHGQNHKGSTYHITKLLLDRISSPHDEVAQFQTNHLNPCVGCFTCIMKDEKLCPHSSQVHPIIEAIEQADLVVIESPNYCMGMSGQLKILFDHMGYRWMSHRPHPAMGSKIGIAVSTAAGLGAGKVTKAIRQQMFWWGISYIDQIAEIVGASSWDEVTPRKKEQIARTVNRLAKKIKKKLGTVKPGLKSTLMMNVMKLQQKGNDWNEVDRHFWVTHYGLSPRR